MPVTQPGPALPGGSYSFTFEAEQGQYLSLATMLVQSNDLFFATPAGGLALFDAAGNPQSGEITTDIAIWNAGTEVDQALGAGPDQAPRQAGANTGADEGGAVVLANEAGWPTAGELVVVTISAQ